MPERFSMASTARSVLLTYYSDFMESFEPDPHSRFIPDLVGRYVGFEAYMRNIVSECNPGLGDLGSVSRLDSLVRLILPEFPQFLGVLAEYHGWNEDVSRAPSPLANPRPVVRRTVAVTFDEGLGLVKGKGIKEASR